MSAFANPYLIPELIMNPVPEPGEPPKTKVMVHGLPGSKFTRQHAPTDAAFEHIKDGIRNLAQINSPLSSFGFRCWKQRLNQRPLRRRQIARIGKLIHPTTILHAFSDRFLVKQASPVAWQHVNLYGRYEFRKQPEPVDVDAIVRELAEIRIGTETALAA